jgi:hypothetical protein
VALEEVAGTFDPRAPVTRPRVSAETDAMDTTPSAKRTVVMRVRACMIGTIACAAYLTTLT